jgi:hypothetical protein
MQVFIRPFSHPWVVTTDPFESQDILLRHNCELDRAPMFDEVVGGLIPMEHSRRLGTNAQLKKNRPLVNHHMAPTFIHKVSAPEMYRGRRGDDPRLGPQVREGGWQAVPGSQ